MATPKQVYESEVYHKAMLCPGSVPWAYFLEVYEALGESLGVTEPSSCTWEYDDGSDYFATACGEAFIFDDGTPADNGMRFCPYCGRRLIEEESDD